MQFVQYGLSVAPVVHVPVVVQVQTPATKVMTGTDGESNVPHTCVPPPTVHEADGVGAQTKNVAAVVQPCIPAEVQLQYPVIPTPRNPAITAHPLGGVQAVQVALPVH